MNRGGPILVSVAVPAAARTLAGPAQPTARVVLRKRDDWAELVAPTHLRPPAGDARGSDGLTLHAEATVDPVVLSVGLPVWPGRWDVIARVEAFGSTRDTHLGSIGTSDLLHRPDRSTLGVARFAGSRRAGPAQPGSWPSR